VAVPYGILFFFIWITGKSWSLVNYKNYKKWWEKFIDIEIGILL
jgi:hypothetical protein